MKSESISEDEYLRVMDNLYNETRDGVRNKEIISKDLRGLVLLGAEMDKVLADYCTILTATQNNGFPISQGIKAVYMSLQYMKANVVYFLKKDENVNYIGKSCNIFSRIIGHNNKDYNRIFIQYFDTEKETSLAEDNFILQYKPRYNKSVNLSNARRYEGGEYAGKEVRFFCHKVGSQGKSKRKLKLDKFSVIGEDLNFIVNEDLLDRYYVGE